MRLLFTSDLHHNHPRSRALAEELIEQINRSDADVLVLVGDTSVMSDGALGACLDKFTFKGVKLFVPGNHELWTRGSDSYELYQDVLPTLVREHGFRWLSEEPFVSDGVAIVGSLGWYDYSFAQSDLGIPRRFYEAKVSPGAAERFPDEFGNLFEPSDDISKHARDVIARWNDGKFVKLMRSDEAFLDELLVTLKSQLDSLRHHPHVIAAIHQLPFKKLLPPPKSAQWDFAKAYLGSEKIGQLLLQYPSVRQVYCGHSHFPAEAQIGHIHAKNTGCGYHKKRLLIVDC